MDALPIVVSFDGGEQVASGLVPGRPSALVDEFDLEGVEEALHRGVVATAVRSAHGGCRPRVGELVSAGFCRVLAAAIRVTDEAGPRSLPLGGHHQGGRCQLGPHMIAHGPTNALAGGGIEYGGQVEPALAGGQVGDVRQPDRVGQGSREELLQEVRCDRQIVTAVGRAGPEPTPCQSPDALTAHEALHPPATDGSALCAQGRVHPR